MSESINLLLCVLHSKIQEVSVGRRGKKYPQQRKHIKISHTLSLCFCKGIESIHKARRKHKKAIQSDILILSLCSSQMRQGRCPQDGGVNLYSQKFYEILSTPLLRNYCIFGVSLIFLMQLPVIPRDTAGEKVRMFCLVAQKTRRIVTSNAFNPLPLLIADEIGGVPAGRGG